MPVQIVSEVDGIPRERRLGPAIELPREELAFVTQEALSQVLLPQELNGGNVVDIFQVREDDFATDIKPLQVTYRTPHGDEVSETIFVDGLSSWKSPKVCVAVENVHAMHRTISVLARKVDNLGATLKSCREHYYKELFYLRYGRQPEADHEVYWFDPKAYEDNVTKEMLRNRLNGREAELVEALDSRERELRFLRDEVSQMGGSQAVNFKSLLEEMPLDQLFVMLKVQNEFREGAFLAQMERFLSDVHGLARREEAKKVRIADDEKEPPTFLSLHEKLQASEAEEPPTFLSLHEKLQASEAEVVELGLKLREAEAAAERIAKSEQLPPSSKLSEQKPRRLRGASSKSFDLAEGEGDPIMSARETREASEEASRVAELERQVTEWKAVAVEKEWRLKETTQELDSEKRKLALSRSHTIKLEERLSLLEMNRNCAKPRYPTGNVEVEEEHRLDRSEAKPQPRPERPASSGDADATHQQPHQQHKQQHKQQQQQQPHSNNNNNNSSNKNNNNNNNNNNNDNNDNNSSNSNHSDNHNDDDNNNTNNNDSNSNNTDNINNNNNNKTLAPAASSTSEEPPLLADPLDAACAEASEMELDTADLRLDEFQGTFGPGWESSRPGPSLDGSLMSRAGGDDQVSESDEQPAGEETESPTPGGRSHSFRKGNPTPRGSFTQSWLNASLKVETDDAGTQTLLGIQTMPPSWCLRPGACGEAEDSQVACQARSSLLMWCINFVNTLEPGVIKPMPAQEALKRRVAEAEKPDFAPEATPRSPQRGSFQGSRPGAGSFSDALSGSPKGSRPGAGTQGPRSPTSPGSRGPIKPAERAKMLRNKQADEVKARDADQGQMQNLQLGARVPTPGLAPMAKTAAPHAPQLPRRLCATARVPTPGLAPMAKHVAPQVPRRQNHGEASASFSLGASGDPERNASDSQEKFAAGARVPTPGIADSPERRDIAWCPSTNSDLELPFM
ncbi:unnamed protein product, partial [Polarella glacialis]